MIYFNSDYLEGAHPALMAKLNETNMVQTVGYGEDEYCAAARVKIQNACQAPEADVHFLVGGTQTNTTVIAAVLRPWQGVLCAVSGHINCHEAGAIESTGHKVITLPTTNGIHEINREMRQVDRPTDVLSFPEFELTPGQLPGPEDADPGTGLIPLGDMVLSMERVAAQAREYGHSKRRELSYLVTHSVLHLLGYDHLDEGPMKAQMRAREEAIMALLGLER